MHTQFTWMGYMCAAVFEVASGSCTVNANNCIQSPNYPSNYNNSEDCQVDLLSNAILQVQAFNTEFLSDKLTVAGMDYCGNSGPNNVMVFGGDTIRWHTDHALVQPGWEICATLLSAGIANAAPKHNNLAWQQTNKYLFQLFVHPE